MRHAITVAVVLIGLALAAPTTVLAGGSPLGAGASTSLGGRHMLSKAGAYAKAQAVLGDSQMADLFDTRPILGWQLQRASECARLSSRTVRCAFVVRRAAPLTDCGATVTMTRRSWYVGWEISTHPGPRAHCSPRAARLAMGAPSVRAIGDWY